MKKKGKCKGEGEKDGRGRGGKKVVLGIRFKRNGKKNMMCRGVLKKRN